jgi:O-antigen/teichoic acid export membrane protein
MSTTQQFKKQLPRNITNSFLSFAIGCLVAIWLTPYLVKHLGAAAYGLVPLAGILTQYVAMITTQVSGSVRRFLIIEIRKPGGNPNIVFNSALLLYLLLAVAQIPLFVIAILNASTLFSIPSGLLYDAQILLFCSAASFLVTLLFSVFGVSIYAENRLDISSVIDLSRSITRLTLIVALFSLFGTKLRYIGYTEMFLAVFFGFVNVYYWKKLTPDLTINFRHIDIKILPPIFKMSFWTIVDHMGALLYLRTDIWIINKFISPVMAGQYAAILVIVEFVRRLGALVSEQAGPTVLTYCAKKEWEALRKLLQMSIKFTSIAMAVPIGIICVTAPELLGVWQGQDFASLYPIVWLTVSHLFINVGLSPLSSLQMGTNRVKIPGLVTFFTGIANIICVYLLGVTLGMGVIGIALGGAIVTTLRNVGFTSIYGARILGLPWTTFIKPLINSFGVIAFVLLISRIPVAKWFGVSSGYISLSVTAAFVSMATVVFIWFALIDKQEKRLFLEMLQEKTGVYVKSMSRSDE